MQKLLVGGLTLFCAVAISAIAAYFSVVGLAALFAAAFIPVAIMGGVLEMSKLVAAGWLHANWGNKNVSRPHRWYLCAAIISLMLITSMGIYGYLAKAHLEQKAPTATIQIDLDQKQIQLDQLTSRRQELQTRQEQINQTISSYLEGNRAAGAAQFMRQQRAERAALQEEIDGLNEQIVTANAEMAPLKREVAGVEAKLGPLKYVADLFGWEDPSSAVKLIILMLMFAFDPLAVVLMISGTITLGEYFRSIESRSKSPAKPEPAPDPVIDDEPEEDAPPELPEPSYEGLLEPLADETSEPEETQIDQSDAEDEISVEDIARFYQRDPKEEVLALLEQNPQVLEELINAVKETDQSEQADVDSGWLSEKDFSRAETKSDL